MPRFKTICPRCSRTGELMHNTKPKANCGDCLIEAVEVVALTVTAVPTKPVCDECGSDDVKADAYAEWCVESQTWEISATFEKGSVCESCGGECSLKWVYVDTGDEV
ncbi:hypothetical protein [Bradyrhizobium lablabi]|uniref:hypothetical protein n=1 Tax=Bradyrhizobium lablabi TaxID=722472 RepID=UPI001BA5B576|nr:hypothetical protein [Bradyrhizobium lablabi]MBR0693633.1 hypothetical protein [Bradyrhizobium lablabi]